MEIFEIYLKKEYSLDNARHLIGKGASEENAKTSAKIYFEAHLASSIAINNDKVALNMVDQCCDIVKKSIFDDETVIKKLYYIVEDETKLEFCSFATLENAKSYAESDNFKNVSVHIEEREVMLDKKTFIDLWTKRFADEDVADVLWKYIASIGKTKDFLEKVDLSLLM